MKHGDVKNLVEISKGILDRIGKEGEAVQYTQIEALRKAVAVVESGPMVLSDGEREIDASDAATLREAVIQARDSALEELRFEDAVKLSHAIAFMQMVGEYLWGVSLEEIRQSWKQNPPA